MRTLVLGGARSGKSSYAEILVPPDAPDVTYVATARPWPGDHDFSARIREHAARRPSYWRTVDTVDAVDVLMNPPPGWIIIDDLGTWLTSTVDTAAAWEEPRGTVAPRCRELVSAVARLPVGFDLILVSPEVGMSVIPEQRSARLFRDEIGRLNSELAEVCDRVILVVAGLPLVLK
ncbi:MULTISPECIES: bifunctional adenosylcobinamide kinase/adenosylcobinamide-phosphate guanylyltransferase [unclassified Corynebacterium]|uniref:bifunctional adenosylcobinamide kinase/adenosylcobinamide-phosphate guanylyltransferase n=1 Tax=unclassified Corynebacterium TaxID=2624378 RepID=UPI0035239975